MRKGSKKLQKFEQFQPEELEVSINVERLNTLIDMSLPLLDEICKIISAEEDRTISNEMFNRIKDAEDSLRELKMMY